VPADVHQAAPALVAAAFPVAAGPPEPNNLLVPHDQVWLDDGEVSIDVNEPRRQTYLKWPAGNVCKDFRDKHAADYFF
jgi:hypothetical protein